MDLDDVVWLWLERVVLEASSIVVVSWPLLWPHARCQWITNSGDIALAIECSCDDRVCCGVDGGGGDWNGIGRAQTEMGRVIGWGDCCGVRPQ